MKRVINCTHHLVTVCCLLAVAIMPAHAETLTFDSIAPIALLGGESVTEAGYSFTASESPMTAELGLQSGTGAVLDPWDAGTCYTAACPANANSNFYAGLNDGGVSLSRADGKAFSLTGLDFAFLAPVAITDRLSGQLVLNGRRNGGGNLSLSLDFGSPDFYGNFMFNNASLSAWAGVQFSSVSFSACIFQDGECHNSLDQPAFNEAQFALDNISVSAVPEPSSLLMLLAGLSVLAWFYRRSNALRTALTASVLLLGGLQAAQAHLLTFTGDTNGGPTYLRPNENGIDYEAWRGHVAYRVYDVFLKEDATRINFGTTCAFDCGIFVYDGAFDPLNASKNYIGGDDNYVGPYTASLGGGLWAGHYTLVITGDSAAEFGFYSATINSTGAFSVSAVPEPSTWLMLGAGLLVFPLMTARRRTRHLRLALLGGLLMLGATQSARADIVTVTGDTTWGDTFHRPDRNGGSPSPEVGLDVAYRAFNLGVSSTDWKHQSIITACEFECAVFLYEGSFNPLRPMQNIMSGEAEEGATMAGLEVWLDVGKNYVLVVAGYHDFDWGVFSTTIGSAGGISISAVPEPSEWMMLLLGLASVGYFSIRKRQ